MIQRAKAMVVIVFGAPHSPGTVFQGGRSVSPGGAQSITRKSHRVRTTYGLCSKNLMIALFLRISDIVASTNRWREGMVAARVRITRTVGLSLAMDMAPTAQLLLPVQRTAYWQMTRITSLVYWPRMDCVSPPRNVNFTMTRNSVPQSNFQ